MFLLLILDSCISIVLCYSLEALRIRSRSFAQRRQCALCCLISNIFHQLFLSKVLKAAVETKSCVDSIQCSPIENPRIADLFNIRLHYLVLIDTEIYFSINIFFAPPFSYNCRAYLVLTTVIRTNYKEVTGDFNVLIATV